MSAPRSVLLSAFACSPLRGSEEGVGWHWAVEIARAGHHVTVLTRSIHRDEIEGVATHENPGERIRFVYLDPAPWIRFQGITRPLGYVYYYYWQMRALKQARRLHDQTPFDIVHHLTYGGIRMPSFMGALGIPFIIGPLGGGEAAPHRLRRGYPLRGKIIDAVRDVSNALVPFDPIMRHAFRTADMIVLRTRDNLACIPKGYRTKVLLEREVGVDCTTLTDSPAPRGKRLRVLFVGRMLYLKGMHLGLRAIAGLADRGVDATLTMVGQGPERARWQNLAEQLRIEDRVNWIEQVPHAEIGKLYSAHHVLLFPSLHESGANVIYEAAACGRPIVCLKLGAPGEVVQPSFGFNIAARDRSEQEVAEDLSAALATLSVDEERRGQMGMEARKWAQSQDWASRIERVYGEAFASS